MAFTENDINGRNSIYCTGPSITKWYVSQSGLHEIQRLLGSVRLRTWQSYVSHVDMLCGFRFIYIFMRLLRSTPPKTSEKFATWRYGYAIFLRYKLPNVNHSLPLRLHLLLTHYTGHHPVIWRKDVPPQECCTSGIPSAVPKDRFSTSTLDSHLQSASFSDHIAN